MPLNLSIPDELMAATEKLKAAKAELERHTAALNQARRDLMVTREKHAEARQCLEAAEASTAVGNGGAEKERKAFVKTRDEMQFAESRVIGLEPKIAPLQLAVSDAELPIRAAYISWRRSLHEGFGLEFRDALAQLNKVVERGLAIADGIEDPRLYNRLARMLFQDLDDHPFKKVHAYRDHRRWSGNEDAAAISKSIRELKDTVTDGHPSMLATRELHAQT